MHLKTMQFKVICLTVMLMDGLWGLTYQEESKSRRIVSTIRKRNKSQWQQQTDKEIAQKESANTTSTNNNNNNNDEDDEKKTLAQQVADGKYGLIQSELFSKPIKRPGIISYEVNPEVPKDNVNNLGGLMPEEIWLAENHLLVLKGGNFGGEGNWPAIDNYVAPQRQVKIPQNPKIPPPFPVQLKDNGPIKYVKGRNGTTAQQQTTGILPFFGFQGNNTHPGNLNVGNGYNPFPIVLPLPAFLPDSGNLTELDEDDPSIYYPAPYDFYYEKENSSHVPAGPLVPGIVIPPPPNFFGILEKKTISNNTTINRTKINSVKKQPTTTTTKKPTTMRITTTKLRTNIPKFTTTTLRPYLNYKQFKNSLPTTVRTTTKSPNEILHTLPPNTPIGDWVPIPAPRPFYISLKPIRVQQTNRNKLKQTNINNRTVLTNVGENLNSHLFNTRNPYYFTGFKPIINKNPLPIYLESYEEKSKNYYYYEQPEFETNTLAPPPGQNIKYITSPLDYFIKEKFPRTNKKLQLSTKKPPVYEYSYSAPGYGTIDEPKIGTNFLTTTGSPHIYEDISTPKYYTTRKPLKYSFIYPNEYRTKPYKPENSQLEDTNKYFTIFGQKINEETTPLPNYPVTTQKNRINYDYDQQTYVENQYYQERPYFIRATHKPNKNYHQPPDNNAYIYRTPSTNLNHYVHHNQQQYNYEYNNPPVSQAIRQTENVNPGHLLHTDLRVNYKNPLPPINPDAEYIDINNRNQAIREQHHQQQRYNHPGTQISQNSASLISYQLPGNGGHFYFLTPQSVK